MATLENRISAVISDADLAEVLAALATVRTKLPFLINLDPADRKNKRKTGTKREGYVVDVYNASTANSGAIPSSFSIAEWTKDEVVNDVMKVIFSNLGNLTESVSDTMLQIGNERVKQADLCYGYLKSGAAGNVALTDELNRIAATFAGQGRAAEIPVTGIPAGGSVTINNAVVGTRLSNMGDTVLKLTVNSIETLVLSGNVAVVSNKQIRVDNQSTNTAGSFSVKTK
jgi:hypothetical protein